MSVWNQITAFFRREADDAKEAVDEFTDRANSSLDRKEAALDASPDEKLAMLQEDIAGNDDAFDDLAGRIGGSAQARSAMAEDERGDPPFGDTDNDS